jgi:glycosyltransferase involved in cell wall biosynthesis
VTIRQIIETVWPGDAVTSMALSVDRMLEGHHSHEVYAFGIHPEMADQALPVAQLPPPARGDVLVYHLSIGNPTLVRMLLARPERLVLIYHNVTPPHLLLDQPELAARCAFGRLEPSLLRDRVVASLADSEYNATELRLLGYDPVVCPVGVDPFRLTGVASTGFLDEARTRLGDHYALAVAQALPHKRLERVLLAMRVLQQDLGQDIGLAVVGHERDAQYAAGLHAAADRLRLEHVWFTGRVPDAVLADLYRGASVLVSASEHEGLGLPLWEAMAFGVPVVAIGHTAVPDTIGEAGLVLPPSAGARQVAKAIHAVISDAVLAQDLKLAGLRRLEAVGIDQQRDTLLDVVQRAVDLAAMPAPAAGNGHQVGASGQPPPPDRIAKTLAGIIDLVEQPDDMTSESVQERALLEELRQARGAAPGTDELDAAVAALKVWPGFSATRISAATRIPGGRLAHALVGKVVRRQTEGVLAQAQEHSRLVAALVQALVREQRQAARTAEATASVLATAIDALGSRQSERVAPSHRVEDSKNANGGAGVHQEPASE